MKLTDLNPEWVDGYGGRKGVMLAFDCPCGKKEPTDYHEDIHRCMIPLRNPLDGGEQFDKSNPRPSWQRVGEDFATLTLTPSILRHGSCTWHGFITNGEIITV